MKRLGKAWDSAGFHHCYMMYVLRCFHNDSDLPVLMIVELVLFPQPQFIFLVMYPQVALGAHFLLPPLVGWFCMTGRIWFCNPLSVLQFPSHKPSGPQP